MTGTNEATAPAADPAAPTVKGMFLRRGAGFGAPAGFVAAVLGTLTGFHFGAGVDLSDPYELGLVSTFALLLGVAGLVAGPLVGLLAAGACVAVHRWAQPWSRRARRLAVSITGGLASAVVTLAAASLARELVAALPWCYAALAAVFGALVMGRAERAWSGWKD